jgi:enterochelin esterase family protein
MPPGYDASHDRYPVLYLLHGGGDEDSGWSTIGRAGFILDNLLAAKKALPMLVVMPNGSLPRPANLPPLVPGATPSPEVSAALAAAQARFTSELMKDVVPFVEKSYRVRPDARSRAIAGLSMGGAHTLNIGIPHLDKFAYLGVYSSGIFGIVPRPGAPAPQGPGFEEKHKAALDDPKLKDGLNLFWFATGKDDFLVETTRATVEMFKQHKFDVIYKETDGAHTWDNWRDYLHEFAPKLFQ